MITIEKVEVITLIISTYLIDFEQVWTSTFIVVDYHRSGLSSYWTITAVDFHINGLLQKWNSDYFEINKILILRYHYCNNFNLVISYDLRILE